MVKLGSAHEHAACFLNEKIHELIISVIGNDPKGIYGDISRSLYPYDIVTIKGIRLVKGKDAKKADPDYKLLYLAGPAYRFDCNDDTSFYSYKLPIPSHSDF
jgi:hypothetical protein